MGTDGTLTVNEVSVHNDTRRLKDALVAAVGRFIFDEGAYYINDTLQVAAYRTLVGIGCVRPADISYSFYSSVSRVMQA